MMKEMYQNICVFIVTGTSYSMNLSDVMPDRYSVDCNNVTGPINLSLTSLT